MSGDDRETEVRSDDLPAGRDLDALVTKQVRGECLHDPVRESHITQIRTGAIQYQCRRCGELLEESIYFADAYDPWKPSENVAQALDLWADLTRRHASLRRIEEQPDGSWLATWWRDSEQVSARGESPALAICRAMLKGPEAPQ